MKRRNFYVLLLLFLIGVPISFGQELEDKIVASDPAFQDHFGGHYGCVDIYGDIAVVSSHFSDIPGGAGANAGTVYIFKWDEENCDWYETDTVFAQMSESPYISDRNAQNMFGESVSLYENTLVIGANEYDNIATPPADVEAGMVYVYTIDPATGIATFQQRLLPFHMGLMTDTQNFARFGESVKIHENRIVVGAPGNATDETGGDLIANSGAVYVYERPAPGSMFAFQQKMVASDRANGDEFGNSVSIWGDFIVAGAQFEAGGGAAYVFQYSTSWNELQKIVAPVPTAGDDFGNMVDIEQTTIVIAALNEDHDAAEATLMNNAGSAYIYDYAFPFYTLTQKIVASLTDREAGANFGRSIGISGNRILVGAGFENTPANSGAAYLFENDLGTWNQTFKFKAPFIDADPGDRFGESVAISYDRCIVAATFDDDDENAIPTGIADPGSCYIYGFKDYPVVYSMNAQPTTVCSGATITLTVNGTLFDAEEWVWYEDGCDGLPIGTGTSIDVTPETTTTYCVRGEGGCINIDSVECECIEVTISDGHWHQTTAVGPYDLGSDVVTDSEGNVYITGRFTDNTSFPGGDNPTVTITDETYALTYVAKYDNCGNLLWVSHAVGTAGLQNEGKGIVVDEDRGYVYVVGDYINAIDFVGSFGAMGTGGTTSGSLAFAGNHGYVARLNMNDGAVDFLENLFISTETKANAVDVDKASGKLYVGGDVLLPSSQFNVFAHSYTPSLTGLGALNWQINGSSFSTIKTLSDLDYHEGTGALWFTGTYKGSLALNYGAPVITTTSAKDAFVARYIVSGAVPTSAQVKTGGINGEMIGNGIEVNDDFGSAFITGKYFGSNTNVFGMPQPLPTKTVDHAYFVAMDALMNPMWSAPGIAGPNAEGLAVDHIDGQAYFTGTYEQAGTSLDFNGLASLPYVYDTDGIGCMQASLVKHTFAVSYNEVGFTTVNWVNGTIDVQCNAINAPGGIATDQSGHAFIVGNYDNTMGYISGTPASGDLTATGQRNAYLMRVDLTGDPGDFEKIAQEEEITLIEDQLIYPNPTTGIATLEIQSGSEGTFKAFDLLGQEVYSVDFAIGDTNLTIDISHLPVGTYMYKYVDNNRKTIQGKLVKVN